MRQLLLFLLLVSPVFAFPPLLSLDGFLTNSSGGPLNGSFSFNFSIYNQSGSSFWSETQALTVSSGRLNALLGSSTALNLPFDQDYYLGVKVGSDSEMSPRFRVASSAYSYAAKSLVSGANASGDLYVSGKLGVGTAIPGHKLDVAGDVNVGSGQYLRTNGSALIGGTSALKSIYVGTTRLEFNKNDGSPMAVILDNGNVGIGTTSPVTKADIFGSLKIGSGVYGPIQSNVLQVQAGNYGDTVSKGQLNLVGGVGDNGYNIGHYIYSQKTAGGGGGAPILVFGELQWTGSAFTNSIERMRIDSSGNVGIGTTTPSTKLHVVGTITGTTKNFAIQHPLNSSKTLVHSTLEGPEVAVFYRGEAQLQGGIAKVTLPSYFEALTSKEGRTVQLTNIDGFDSLAVKTINGHIIQDGFFTVYSSDPSSTQRFFWEVKAVRSDVPPLEVEQKK